jgi:chemotaxis protein methyltransferase CheR
MIAHELSLSDTTYRLLKEFIYRHCGLFFEDGNKYLLERRLANRVALHQLRDFQEYYYYLMYDKNRTEELNAVVDTLTINETYFFRETPQLKAFAEEILPEIAEAKGRAGQRSLRIWSAGCSTGEEPHTVAILILESGLFPGWDVEIFGSDISHRVLKIARKGEYGPSSFRCTDPVFRDKYFTPTDGKWRVIDPVRRLVHFGYLNLFDSSRIALLGAVDLVFCRNVIIYFDKEGKKKVIAEFEKRLKTGGYLLLGHSESLINLSNAFSLKHLKNDMVYQKA